MLIATCARLGRSSAWTVGPRHVRGGDDQVVPSGQVRPPVRHADARTFRSLGRRTGVNQHGTAPGRASTSFLDDERALRGAYAHFCAVRPHSGASTTCFLARALPLDVVSGAGMPGLRVVRTHRAVADHLSETKTASLPPSARDRLATISGRSSGRPRSVSCSSIRSCSRLDLLIHLSRRTGPLRTICQLPLSLPGSLPDDPCVLFLVLRSVRRASVGTPQGSP